MIVTGIPTGGLVSGRLRRTCKANDACAHAQGLRRRTAQMITNSHAPAAAFSAQVSIQGARAGATTLLSKPAN